MDMNWISLQTNKQTNGRTDVDYLIIFRLTFEEHHDNLETVFNKLREYKLELAHEKSLFSEPRYTFYVALLVLEE